MKNRSKLGDPISLTTKSSNNSPTKRGDTPTNSSSPSSVKVAKDISKPQDTYASSSAPVMAPTPTESDTDEPGSESSNGKGVRETLKQKAVKKIHGEGANPSRLGDPASLKAETSDTVPTEEDREARGTKMKTGKRDSKL